MIFKSQLFYLWKPRKRTGRSVFQSRQGTETSPKHRAQFYGAPGLLLNGHRGLFPAGRSVLSVKLTMEFRAKVMNESGYTPTPPIRLPGVCRKNFTFTFYIMNVILTETIDCFLPGWAKDLSAPL